MCKINYAPTEISALYSGPEYDCNFGRTHEDTPVHPQPKPKIIEDREDGKPLDRLTRSLIES